MLGLVILAIKLLVVIKIGLFISFPKAFVLCHFLVFVKIESALAFDLVKLVKDGLEATVHLLI